MVVLGTVDSKGVMIPASLQFSGPSAFHKFFFGGNNLPSFFHEDLFDLPTAPVN